MTLLSEVAQKMIDDARSERDKGIEDLLGIDSSVPKRAGVKPKAKGKAGAAAPATAAETYSPLAEDRRTYPYTAEAMVTLMIDNPNWSHKQFAEHFGQRQSWFAGVLISNNFQAALDKRRDQVNNPLLTGTMDDMFKALTLQSLVVLQQRLESSTASDDLILKAATLGVKALGMGTPGAGVPVAPPPTLRNIADKLLASTNAGLVESAKTAETVEVTEILDPEVPVADDSPEGSTRDWSVDLALGELPR